MPRKVTERKGSRPVAAERPPCSAILRQNIGGQAEEKFNDRKERVALERSTPEKGPCLSLPPWSYRR
jgi:hypothetical protein